MCDCYEDNCQCCGRPIPVHIGDFSTSRGCLEIYCWEDKCREMLLARILGQVAYGGPLFDPGAAEYPRWKLDPSNEGNYGSHNCSGKMIFVDDEVEVDGKRRAVVFLVDMPGGISVNGPVEES